MTTFWILAAAMALLALSIVLLPLIKMHGRTQGAKTASARLPTIEVLRDQRDQLDAELAAGTLDAEQHRQGREEIERRVLDESGPSAVPAAMRPATAAGSTAPAPLRPWKTVLFLAL
ncbi:MAG: c-type cytochrome biogenesis protein CcmI, partial [Burkholderiaceae bacterium]|nr:c-type cytochrome biogenesis protein CcmI [Burkholderiaceae bacterium]